MRYLFLFISVLFFSCGGNKEEIPSDILPKEKFILVMTDMYLLEAKFSHASLINKPSYKKGIEEYEKLFTQHHTTKEIVEKSIDYYAADPVGMKEIEMIILDSINTKSR